MQNLNFVNQIKNYQNPILNFFANKNPNFYFNFLNKNKKVGNHFIGTREQWSAAHFLVQNVTNTNNDNIWTDFEAPQAYYISFNTIENQKDHCLGVSLREDLIHYWGEVDTTNLNLFVVSTMTQEIYTIAVKDLLAFYLRNRENITRNTNSLYNDLIFTIDNNWHCEQMNFEDPKNILFKPEYFKPEYIGNICYAKYNCKKPIYMYVYNENKEYVRTVKLRSVKEAYDSLVHTVGWDKSVKTLQRAVAVEKLLTGFYDEKPVYFYFSINETEQKNITCIKVAKTYKHSLLKDGDCNQITEIEKTITIDKAVTPEQEKQTMEELEKEVEYIDDDICNMYDNTWQNPENKFSKESLLKAAEKETLKNIPKEEKLPDINIAFEDFKYDTSIKNLLGRKPTFADYCHFINHTKEFACLKY